MSGEGAPAYRRAALEHIARWTPALILLYFALHVLLRLALSANLETDEAQFFGQTFLALGYQNSHPPLYNWLVAGALTVTGGHWIAALALVKALLLAGTYLLAFDLARRITGRALTGLVVVASLLLLPQIVWKSQITLAHSVLVMFAVIAVFHALVLIVQRGDGLSFLWLGLAAGIGALAKYNFFLALAAIMAAVLSIAPLRRRLAVPGLLATCALFAALFTPHLLWALGHVAETTRRLDKLDRADAHFGDLDIADIGVDGLLGMVLRIAAWAGPLLLAWWAVRRLGRPAAVSAGTGGDETIRDFASLFGRSLAIGLGGFAVLVLAADVHSVHERYLTPILMPLPFWLALAWPLEDRAHAAGRFLRLGGTVAVLMVTAWPLWVLFGKDQFAFPYGAFAESVAQTVPAPFALLSANPRHAANLAIRIGGASVWAPEAPSDQVVLVWRSKAPRAPGGLVRRLGNGYRAAGPPMRLDHVYDNFSGARARIAVQLYRRSSRREPAAERSISVTAPRSL